MTPADCAVTATLQASVLAVVSGGTPATGERRRAWEDVVTVSR